MPNISLRRPDVHECSDAEIAALGLVEIPWRRTPPSEIRDRLEDLARAAGGATMFELVATGHVLVLSHAGPRPTKYALRAAWLTAVQSGGGV